MEKDYYKRYWAREFKKGVANRPPEWNPKDLNRVLNALKPYAYGKILDAGCGDGFFTNEVSKLPNVEKCFGIDISEYAIDLARNKYPHIEFQVGSVTELKFEPNYFDFICAIEVAEHIIDVEQMLKEFNRVLKKNQGGLIITTTDFNLLKKVIISTLFFERYFYPTNPHIRFFTRSTLKNILNKIGFKAIKHKWNGSYLGFMPKGQIMIAQKVKAV